MSRNPCYKFSYGSMDRHPIEVDNRWVLIDNTVAMISVQRLLRGIFHPSANLSGVEFAEALKTRATRHDEDYTTTDDRCGATDVNTSGNVHVGRRGVDSDLVQTVPGSVMVNTADNKINVI